MRNMKDIKKAFLGTLGFISCVFVVSFVIIDPYLSHYMLGEKYQDAPIRADMAGTIDMLVVGASQSVRAFDTNILDEDLNINSYNLAVPLMTMDSRYFILQKEIKRNNVSTVVLEISYDTLLRERKEEGPEGIITTLGNLDTYAERFKFLKSCALLKEYGQIYYQTLAWGISSWRYILTGRTPTYSIKNSTKGYKGLESSDITITEEEFNKIYQSSSIKEKFNDINCMYLNKMIEICVNQEIRVIICVVPVSERRVLANKNSYILDEYLQAVADTYTCEFYNFNLIKGRDQAFPETTAFYDTGHMSAAGAESFTHIFCEVITAENPESYFWESYDEAEQHGNYAKYLKK